jgi:hydrogenase maturation protease
MNPRILIACIGNIFLGDDGFGPAVAQRLAQRALPVGVILKDLGIRALDLTYALLDAYELVILVDACARGAAPGTLYLLEPDAIEYSGHASMDAHSMSPAAALRIVKSMGGSSAKILVVGCEPADLGPEEGKLGLSDPVSAAVDQAIAMIETVIAKHLTAEPALEPH